MKSEILSCLLISCPPPIYSCCGLLKIHFTFWLLKNSVFTFKETFISQYSYTLFLFQANFQFRNSHLVCFTWTCIIAMHGIISDTRSWRACRAGFKAHLSQIYSLIQEFKYGPAFLNIKFSGREGKKNPKTTRLKLE